MNDIPETMIAVQLLAHAEIENAEAEKAKDIANGNCQSFGKMQTW